MSLEEIQENIKVLGGKCDEIRRKLSDVFDVELVEALHKLQVLHEQAKEVIGARKMKDKIVVDEQNDS